MPAAARADKRQRNLSESIFAWVCCEARSIPPPVMTHTVTRRSILQTLAAAAALVPLVSHGAHNKIEVEPDSSGMDGFSGTRLEHFLRSHGIRPAHLARESGYSRQHLFRLRFGRMQPSLRCITHLTAAARRITRKDVSARDLFEGERAIAEGTR